MHISTLIHVTSNKNSTLNVVGNVIGLLFFQTAGMLTSSRWVLTTIAMIICTVAKITYYATDLGINDYTT